MWRRWFMDLGVELHWIKRDLIRRWRLDTPVGVMGIIMLISGLLLLVIIGDAIAHLFRMFTPWVSGSRISEVYWQSIGFGIKTSLTFLIFIGSFIVFIFIKFSERR